jgi:aldehyde:ferredoxin oxidoreductase
MSGYWGNILRVDLTESKIVVDSLPEEWRKAYIGGTGLSAKIL